MCSLSDGDGLLARRGDLRDDGYREKSRTPAKGQLRKDHLKKVWIRVNVNEAMAIAKSNHKASVIQGQTVQRSRRINLLGVKQICISVNEMDCDTAGYMKAPAKGNEGTCKR